MEVSQNEIGAATSQQMKNKSQGKFPVLKMLGTTREKFNSNPFEGRRVDFGIPT